MKKKEVIEPKSKDSPNSINDVQPKVTISGNNFHEILEFLEILPDHKSKIKNLRKIIINCETNIAALEQRNAVRIEIVTLSFINSWKTLLGLCKIKVNQLEKLAELEIMPEQAATDIAEYEEKNQIDVNLKDEEKSFTLRQKVLVLMLLTFRRLDAPEDLQQENIVKFFFGLTGGDTKKLRSLIKDPTAHKGNKQSIKLLCDDLHFVRNHFGKLGISENIEKIENEIDFLIQDLEKS